MLLYCYSRTLACGCPYGYESGKHVYLENRPAKSAENEILMEAIKNTM